MKFLKKMALFLLLLFIIAQFFGPEKNEGEISTINAFVNETKPSENVLNILKTSCFDCHSAKTNYPWYNNITPVNYWLAEHVNDGKKHLNFSKWSTYSVKKKEHKMDELHEEVEKKKMPLDSYTWTHSEANLTQSQIKEIVTWGKKVQADYKLQIKNK